MTKKQKRKLLKKALKAKKALLKLPVVPIMEVAQIVQDNTPELPPHRYTLAGEIKLFDEDGRHLKNYKGIINAEKRESLFSIVSKGYKVVQHDEVVDAVESCIQGLELSSDDRVIQMDNGGRIRFITKFPNITINIKNEIYTMQMFWDNSYNLTTGVRLILGVCTPRGRSLYLDSKLANFYHRHTKGIDLANLKRAITAGMATFLDNVAREFNDMIKTPMTMEKAINFLDTCINEKVIASVYLETLKNELRKMPVDEMDSQWILYNLINSVLDERVKSIDTKERHINALNKKLKSIR